MRTNITKWTPARLEYLQKNYANTGNDELSKAIGIPAKAIGQKAYTLGLFKTRFIKGKLSGRTKWTPEMIQYLRDNITKRTNAELAMDLGLKMTITRNKITELGIKRIEMEYWSAAEVLFLLENYGTMGDVEIADALQERWPKKKGWSKHHIAKKRGYLKLIRTPGQIKAIVDRRHGPDGRMNTITTNSCSVNLTDGFVANIMSRRDPELKQAIKAFPELIDLKRKSIQLTRALKNAGNAPKKPAG